MSEAPPRPPVPDDVVVATVAAPAVRGLRGALAALTRYGAAPHLAAGTAPLDRAAWGAGQLLAAAQLVWRDRALRRAALLPTLLTAGACGVLAALLHQRELLGLSGKPLAALHVYMVAFVGLASMPPTLLQGLWIRVANEARRALGLPPGEQPFAGRSYLRTVIAELVKAARQAAVVAVGLLPVVFVLTLLPDALHAPAALAALWALYWVVVDAFELPIEVIPGPRHRGPEPWFAEGLRWVGARSRLLRPFSWGARLGGRLATPWREELDFTARHSWECAGMGVLAGALLAVPVLDLAFRAVVITAATALVARLEAGTPPPSSGQP
jgi:hypothetical protein